MSDVLIPTNRPRAGIAQISTRWPLIQDPVQFVMRYAPAIRGYLAVFLKNPHDVDDVCQAFLLRVVERGVVEQKQLHGRFRDYLIATVRNAALAHLRRKPSATQGSAALADVAAPLVEFPSDQEWLSRWRRVVLDSAWEALENHQIDHSGNLAHTALQTLAHHPQEDMKQLAARVGQASGRVLGVVAFRKLVSRARRLFAEFLVAEVARSLEEPTPCKIEEELIDLGVMKYVRAFLPDDWRTSGQLTDAE